MIETIEGKKDFIPPKNPRSFDDHIKNILHAEPKFTPRLNPIFEIGDRLYASCSAEFYGEIIGIGHNNDLTIPVIDIIVNDPDDLVALGWDSEFPDGYVRLELPEGVKPILRGLRWKISSSDAYMFEKDGYVATGNLVVCNTPGNGCYRCTKLFSVMRKTV